MRKSYLLMAAAATIFAACSETDFVNPVPETEQEIGFENHVGKTTRAEITNEAALATAGGFKVWGWKTPTAATLDWSVDAITQIFNAQVVSGGDGAWTYSPKKYWDKNSTYNFYAVAPAVAPEGVIYSCTNPASGMITITGAQSALVAATAYNDFLIDRNGAQNVSGNHTGSHGKVNFDFNHIMAKVSIQLKRNVAEKITVNSITMSGWNSNTGKFVQTLTATPGVGNTSEWTMTAAGTGGTVTFEQGYVLYSEPAVGEELDLAVSAATPVAVEDSYIMVPQTVGTLTFTLDYTITYSDNLVEEFKSQTGTLTNQIWGTDTHTTYTILVGPEPIEFEVNTVSGFTTVTPNPELPIE